MNPHGCIAHPCSAKRKKGSGFCAKHHKAHETSKWVTAWRKYQKEITKAGSHKKVLWAAPD